MPLIKQSNVVPADSWLFIADDAAVPATGDVVLGLRRVLAGEAANLGGKLGLRLDPEDELTELSTLLPQLSLIAVTFPKFGDGRGYSKARLLRERFGYKGELRAVGEVLADQLFFLKRCGFDAFELAAGKDVNAALAAFTEFSVLYQAATDEPRPLYRRATR